MSKEIFRNESISLTQFCGKDNKLKIQISQEDRFVQLSVRDSYELINELSGWIKQVTEKQAQELKETINELKIKEKTLLNDAVECQHFISDLKILDIPITLLGN